MCKLQFWVKYYDSNNNDHHYCNIDSDHNDHNDNKDNNKRCDHENYNEKGNNNNNDKNNIIIIYDDNNDNDNNDNNYNDDNNNHKKTIKHHYRNGLDTENHNKKIWPINLFI